MVGGFSGQSLCLSILHCTLHNIDCTLCTNLALHNQHCICILQCTPKNCTIDTRLPRRYTRSSSVDGGRPSYSSITVGLQQHCPLRILAWQVFAIHPQPQPAPRYLAAVHSRAGNICTAAVEYRALLILSLIQVRLARPSHGRRPTRKDSVFSPTPTNPTTSNSPTSPAGIQTDPDMVGRKIFEDVHVWRTFKIAKEQ